MDTKPLQNLLDRDLAVADVREIIDIASPLLQKLVNNATNVFGRCLNSSRGEIDVPIIFSYLHIIEMIDGIEILISQSCSVPAAPLLRSSFEALLSIEFILEKEYDRRSKSWIVGLLHDKIRYFELLDPQKPRGAQFIKSFNNEIKFINKKLPDISTAHQKIIDIKDHLSLDEYADIEKEWLKCKKAYQGKVNWFSLFNGPQSIRKLAIYLERETRYDILYTQWSSITHAHDISRFWKNTSDVAWGICSLRNPSDLKLTISLASSFLLDATLKVLKKFREGEAFNMAKWYLKEIRSASRAMVP